MTRETSHWATVGVGFVVAIGILLALVYVVGIRDVLAVLAGTDRRVLAALFGIAALWMLAWSATLYLVLGAVGLGASLGRSVLIFTSMLFSDSVLPFSVVGSQPVATVLVARGTDASYEQSFAIAAIVGVLNFLPAPALAVSGSVYFALTRVPGQRVEVELAVLMAIILGLALGGYVGWRYRWSLARGLPAIVVALQRRLDRVLPWVSISVSDPDAVETSLGMVIKEIETVAADRRTLTASLCTATIGWVLLAAMLWLALLGAGYGTAITASLFIVPLATVSDLVPLPGGVGSIDAVLVVLLVATTGVPAAVATAAVLVYRSASFLFPVLVGGTALVFVRASPDRE